MKEVFLYQCETCSIVKRSETDNSNTWYTMCQVCRGCEFHKKIKIVIKNMDDGSEVHVFAVGE